MSHGNDIPTAARTDVGMRRDHNEDAMLAAPPLFAVADGVGGSAKGEVASQLALDLLARHVGPVSQAGSAADAVHAMEQAVLEACRAVWEAQDADDQLRGMATTLTAAVVRSGGEVVVGHVGDSRLYVVNEAGARLITDDHSVVAELVRAGRLDPEEAAHHPQRNVITRALGPEPDVAVDSFVLHVGPGDWLLACSDGLTGHVHDEELARAVLESARPDPDVAARRLVDQANARGGSDNITVVLAQPVPSDVSGELRIRPLAAVGGSGASGEREVESTSSMPVVESPAEASGPISLADGGQPMAIDVSELDSKPYTDTTAGADPVPRPVRRTLVIAAMAVLAAGGGAFAWSQSYFVTRQPGGTVGVDRGFPLLGLAQEHRSSTLDVAAVPAVDRERLVDSHRLLSRQDAERVLDDLVEEFGTDPSTDSAATAGGANPADPAPVEPRSSTGSEREQGRGTQGAPTNP